MIPCLCLFIALSSLFSELVGAKPLHLLTQTVLLLAQTQTSDKQKRTRTLFRKESGSRYRILKKHGFIKFEVEEIQLANKYEALASR